MSLKGCCCSVFSVLKIFARNWAKRDFTGFISKLKVFPQWRPMGCGRQGVSMRNCNRKLKRNHWEDSLVNFMTSFSNMMLPNSWQIHQQFDASSSNAFSVGWWTLCLYYSAFHIYHRQPHLCLIWCSTSTQNFLSDKVIDRVFDQEMLPWVP